MTDEGTKSPRPGQYVAKVLDYAIGQTKDGKPQVLVVFGFEDSAGEKFQRAWAGSLNAGKAREITMRALRVMGFQGAEDRLKTLALGVDSNELSLTKQVMITVADEVNPNNGESSSRIKWVNEIGGPIMSSRLSTVEAAAILDRMFGMNRDFAATGPSDESVPF